jgi:hypothetical protein
VEKLFEYGAEVNSEDINGQTALFYCAREGHKDMCILLIKKGANVNKQDKKHQTAMNFAKNNKKQEVVQLLLESGANLTKEAQAEKQKPSKKVPGNKKKQTDNIGLKKYVLTHYKDGMWKPVSEEELKEFMERNKEVGAYLQNPGLLGSLKLPPVSESVQIYDHWDKAAKKVLSHLWKQQGAWHFFEAVDPIKLNIPDYPNVIKNPMDFGTIKMKLSNGSYGKCKEFCNDVELVFANCIRYNGEASDFGVLAKKLLEEFKKQCQLISLDYYMS